MDLAQKISACGTILKTILRNSFQVKFEPEVYILDQLIPPGSICFDIGAAYGRYALAMSKAAGPSGLIYCFEPAEHNQLVLSAIQKFYRLQNVRIIKKALSDQEGTTMLAIPVKKNSKFLPALGYSTAHLATDSEAGYVGSSIPTTTIDRFVQKENLTRLDFIKCDVEGAELLVFKGGEETIARFKPVVLCEIYQTWLRRFKTAPDEIQMFFDRFGYKVFRWREKRLEEIKQATEDRNYVFIHPEFSLPHNFQKPRREESNTSRKDKAGIFGYRT